MPSAGLWREYIILGKSLTVSFLSKAGCRSGIGQHPMPLQAVNGLHCPFATRPEIAEQHIDAIDRLIGAGLVADERAQRAAIKLAAVGLDHALAIGRHP